MDKQEKKKERRKTILILIGALFVIFGIFGGTFLSDAMGFDLLNIPKAPIPQDGQDSKSGGAGFVTPGQITDGSVFNHGQGRKAFSGFGDDGSLFEKTNASGINADGDSANGKDTGDGFLFTLKGTGNGKEGAGIPLVPGTGSNSSSTSHKPGSSGPTSSDSGQDNSSGGGSSSGSSSSSPSSGTIIPGNRPTPGGGNHSVPISEVKLDQTDVTINRHNTLQLTALISPSNTTESKTTVWSSSNADVATVDSKGLVTGVNAGETAITAKVGSHTATCNVTVVVLMEGISINYEELSVVKGDTAQLTAKTIPEDTTEDKAIVWSSSDPEVATVDGNGLVTAIKTGKATIKAKSELTGFSGSCEITVVSPMTGISMDKTTLTVNRDRTDKLAVIFSPEDTTDDQTVTWSSSDPSIAAVDQQGNVTGHKIGTATITATCGKFTATCDVTVVAMIDNIYLDQPELVLDRGTNGQLTVSYEPPDTTEDKTVTWTSSNPEIATVDNTGKVTAVSAGDAKITAKVGTHTATCNVTVVVLIHSISLDKANLTLDRGTNDQLKVSIDPPDTTEDTTVTWTSSNPAVATVDSTGKVAAISKGETTITAKIGTHIATCKVTIVILIHSISLDKADLTLDRGTNDQLKVSIDPPDTTEDTTVTWTSSNPAVATVDSTGKVTAISKGSTTITVKIGTHTATCKITVVVLIHSISLDKASLTLDRGTNQSLAVSIDPADTTENKAVTWTSSNPAVATVDSTGKVTAVSKGSTTITAKVGTHTATCKITVVVLIHSISLDKTSLSLKKTNTANLTVSYDPADTTEIKTVTWTSSNPAAATVDSSGKVTATSAGETTITAKVGTHTATCVVGVGVKYTVTVEEGDQTCTGEEIYMYADGSGEFGAWENDSMSYKHGVCYINIDFSEEINIEDNSDVSITFRDKRKSGKTSECYVFLRSPSTFNSTSARQSMSNGTKTWYSTSTSTSKVRLEFSAHVAAFDGEDSGDIFIHWDSGSLVVFGQPITGLTGYLDF
ncbi:protein of unknown function [Ruminococcaceae bacterium BL-6]|nr:protein of unknown function [Ruminococcaceae bacterium BL-6]